VRNVGDVKNVGDVGNVKNVGNVRDVKNVMNELEGAFAHRNTILQIPPILHMLQIFFSLQLAGFDGLQDQPGFVFT
jgi:hypothetical protein